MGAGMSGLTAALGLQDEGVDVLLVEASGRIGGRIYSHAFPSPHEHAVGELGAMRVLEEHSATRHALQRAGLEERMVASAPMFASPRSLLATARGVGTAADILTTPRGPRAGARTLRILLDAVAPRTVAALARPSRPLPVLPAFRAEGDLPARLEEFLRVCAARLQAMHRSLAVALQELAVEFTPAFTIEGGLSRLPEQLAGLLHRPPLMEHRLVRLVERSQGVDTICRSAAGEVDVRAAAAVLAIPPWLLSQLELDGPVRKLTGNGSAEQTPASARKVLLRLQRPFWEDEGITCGGSAGGPLLRQVFYPRPSRTQESCECAVLTAYATAEDSAALGRIPAAERPGAVLAALARLHPGLSKPGAMLDFVEIDWSQVPFAQGAFHGDWRPGQPSTARTKPTTTRCALASDSLQPHPGWIEGAITSGEQAALTVLRILRCTGRPSQPTPPAAKGG
ncbi:flavin monoamine oxidase family protein [Spirillospora sp. CA-253888]